MKTKKEIIEEMFDDLFIVNTEGRNDIRRKRIQGILTQAQQWQRDRILERLEPAINSWIDVDRIGDETISEIRKMKDHLIKFIKEE